MTYKKTETPLEKEWRILLKKESALERVSVSAASPKWRDDLEAKVPDKVFAGLQSAVCKGFSIVFKHGTSIIEKTYHANEIQQEHQLADHIVMNRGTRSDFRKLRAGMQSSKLGNIAISTVEGVGLGAMGIGMPDIVLFVGVLLKGVYETALRYGFTYDTPRDQFLILKMIEAALSRGEKWSHVNAEVECLLVSHQVPTESAMKAQIERTGDAFASEMLLGKFVQGFPVVGILGGISNPVYYHRVMKYVEIKYQKCYLREVSKRKKARTSSTN